MQPLRRSIVLLLWTFTSTVLVVTSGNHLPVQDAETACNVTRESNMLKTLQRLC